MQAFRRKRAGSSSCNNGRRSHCHSRARGTTVHRGRSVFWFALCRAQGDAARGLHPSNVIDYLILGGGSAGCVLAARLSEDASNNVCLVEAGRDISQATMPADIRSRYPGRAYLDTANLWRQLKARMSAPAALRRYEQARLLGGGSAINALMANRGSPADYDEWQTLGAQGWNWQACLPYFRKLETDCDFNGPTIAACMARMARCVSSEPDRNASRHS